MRLRISTLGLNNRKTNQGKFEQWIRKWIFCTSDPNATRFLSPTHSLPAAHLILSCYLPLPSFPLESKIVCRIRKSLTKWLPWESTYSRPSRASPFRLPTPPPPLTSMGSLAWFESASQCRSRFLWSCLWRSRRPTRRERVARRTAETRGGRGSEWRSMATRQLSLVLL